MTDITLKDDTVSNRSTTPDYIETLTKFSDFLYDILPTKYDFYGLLLYDYLFGNGILINTFLSQLSTLCLSQILCIPTSIALLYAPCVDTQRFLHQRRRTPPSNGRGNLDDIAEQQAQPHFLRPLLFPCQTSHTRLFPKKHSFQYSYLLVGIPVAWRGSVGNILSADRQCSGADSPDAKRAWFEVDGVDHLEWGDHEDGLKGKLRDYLSSQDEDPDLYPYVYLATAPKFLGYLFNPVSFWYLYDAHQNLRAMILEVNNTFNERRPYLLKGNPTIPIENDLTKSTSDHSDGKVLLESNASRRIFTETWQKDFHVSPFNSRKGSYSLKATDPFFASENPSISNVITLSSSKEHPKLIASINSTMTSIDPLKMDLWEVFNFLRMWWWVGFATFPRIVKEAGKLFFKRRLHVWYRPEVLSTSIGRKPTIYENALAPIAEHWLRHLVEESFLSSSVEYIPLTSVAPRSYTFTPKNETENPTSVETITLKPTSPLFYSTLATANNPNDAIQSMLTCSEPLTSVLFTNNAGHLLGCFRYQRPIDHNGHEQARSVSTFVRLRWLPVAMLRGFSFSDLDLTAMHKPFTTESVEYRRAAFKLLLAKRVAFGLVEAVDLAFWMMRSFLYWLSLETLVGLVAHGGRGLSSEDASFLSVRVVSFLIFKTLNQVF